MSSIFTDRINGTCHIDAAKDILVISNKVQGHNSPLPKTLLKKISTLTPIWSSLAVWMVPWQREREENFVSSDKRENISEQIDGGEDGGGWGWVCEADGDWEK